MIKTTTKIDNFYQSSVKISNNVWVILKRNTHENKIDIKLLDKHLSITQDLASFYEGKYTFNSYPGQVYFIELFKKYPKLKRELQKVSYPLHKYMSLKIDWARFERKIKYYLTRIGKHLYGYKDLD